MKRQAFLEACKKHKLAKLELICVVATQWNSLAQAIGRALRLRAAIDRLLQMPRYDKRGKKGLARFKLSDTEWALLSSLYDLLEVCLSHFSRALTLAHVLQ